MLKRMVEKKMHQLTPNVESGEEGFSLIELLVAMLVMAVLMVMLGGIFVGFNQSTYSLDAYLRDQAQITNTVNVLSAELREAQPQIGMAITNVLAPQSCITVTSCTNAAQNTLDFAVSNGNGGQNIYQWQISKSGSGYIITQQQGTMVQSVTGTTFTPTGTLDSYGIVEAAQFCYLSRSGESMTGNAACPGYPDLGSFVPLNLATCAIEVTLEIKMQPSPGVGPIEAEVGIGLRNQTALAVTTQAVSPPGGQAGAIAC